MKQESFNKLPVSSSNYTEENKVSNPKPLFLRALLKEAQSDWTQTASSSTFQPALH